MAYELWLKPQLGTSPSTGPREHSSLLQNLDREPRKDVLGGPGDNYDVYKYSWPFTVVRRQPLVYAPRSTARHNYGLLPDIDAMAGMELAYRHQGFRECEQATYPPYLIGARFLASILVSAGILLVGHYIRAEHMLYAAPVLSTIAVIRLLLARRARPINLLLALVLPILVLWLTTVYAALFSNRLVGAGLCSLATTALIVAFGLRPFRFYLEWAYTHPRLKPESRRSMPAVPAPDYLLLLVVLAAATLVPVLSTTLAMLTIAGLCFYRLRRCSMRLRELSAHAVLVLTPFLTYGDPDSYAPGTWQARVPYLLRARTAVLIVVPFLLTLTASLNLFQPWVDVTRVPNVLHWLGTGALPAGGELLRGSPFSWLSTVATEVNRTGWSNHFITLPAAIALATLLPTLVLVTVFRDPIAAAARARRAIDGDPLNPTAGRLDDDARTEWQWYVDRIRNSAHTATGPLGEVVREADHLFLGVEPHASFPVLLHEKLLAEHTYMVGDSGSGKTSLGLMPLLIQLIRGHADERGGTTPCPPIVIIDLKGDPALFHTVRAEAERDGRAEFRFFNPEKGQPSHYFNPFASLNSENRTDIQLCHILLDALGLNHGEGYGRGYYSRQSRALLSAALQGKTGRDGALRSGDHATPNGSPTPPQKPRSLAELHERLREAREAHGESYRDTLELVSTVEALNQYKMLASITDPSRPYDSIHMPSVLERRQVVYFWLPAVVESVSAREIAKLALYCLLTACIDRQRADPPLESRQAYVVIDEFQRIAGENFRVILEQARSFGLGMVLANQSVADLRTPDVDLRPTVRTNTRVKRYFSVTDPQDVASLSAASGEELMFARSWSTKAGGLYTEYVATAHESRSESQTLKPRLTSNDILAVSDHPLDSILHVSRGSGYTQFAGLPIPVRCTWPISRAEYDARRRAPWPTRKEYPEGTTTCSDKSPVDIDRERDAQAQLEAHARLQSLLAMRA